jgi:DNA-binding MarR family transcriptional regulator
VNNKQAALLFKTLLQGPHSRHELAERTNSNPKTVGGLLREMKDLKLIYVIGYTNESDGRNRVKVYALGDAPDAEPQQTRTQRDRSRKNYLKKLSEQVKAEVKTTFADGKGLWQ